MDERKLSTRERQCEEYWRMSVAQLVEYTLDHGLESAVIEAKVPGAEPVYIIFGSGPRLEAVARALAEEHPPPGCTDVYPPHPPDMN